MMTDQQIIEVVSAHRDGKEIECRLPGCEWEVLRRPPSWSFAGVEYRVRRKPKGVRRKPREWWIYDDIAYPSLRAAKAAAKEDHVACLGPFPTFHVREVLE